MIRHAVAGALIAYWYFVSSNRIPLSASHLVELVEAVPFVGLQHVVPKVSAGGAPVAPIVAA